MIFHFISQPGGKPVVTIDDKPTEWQNNNHKRPNPVDKRPQADIRPRQSGRRSSVARRNIARSNTIETLKITPQSRRQ